MNKEGQFFLIAAVVIIAIIASIATIHNKVKISQENTSVYDLSKEINFEASQVIDNGVLADNDANSINDNLKLLTDHYAKSNPDSDLIVVYGNQEQINVRLYNNTNIGQVGVDISGTSSPSSTSVTATHITTINTINPGDHIEIDFGVATYDFDLRPGKTFYIILKKDKDLETFVAST